MTFDFDAFFARLRFAIVGPQLLAFVPALTLSAFWFGGEKALILAALIIPLAVSFLDKNEHRSGDSQTRDGLTDLNLKPRLISDLDQMISAAPKTGRSTAVIAIQLDDVNDLTATYGPEARDTILQAVADRIRDIVREGDCVARIDEARFAISLAPMRRADLETLIQMSVRIQKVIAEPFSLDATKVFMSACVGFCLPHAAPNQSGRSYLDAAETALDEARANGAGSIRAFSGTSENSKPPAKDHVDIDQALASGQIVPWFQAQVSTDTGEVTGFEALARWHHPTRGTLSPSDFLDDIEAAGLNARLGQIILYHALSAIKKWQEKGYRIPSVSVNFSSEELSDPKLVDRIKWDLDRFDLTADRLTVEILENVIAESEDDVATRNIRALGEMGCRIDLDDFGTGHASLASIRRFAVNRIKIDRSYVSRCDTDRDQQDMLAAILTMAERIDLETLAEGVETVGEHAMLAQLGCRHVQGYSVGRPMAFKDTLEWIETHERKLEDTLRLGRRAG